MHEAELIKPWYRQFWPWFLMAPPLTAVIGGMITIWLAVKSDGGLVTGNYYQDGLEINRQLEKIQAARDMSIRATFLFAEEDRQITVYLQGDMPTPDSLKLQLSAPLAQGKDISFQLIKLNQNLFRSQYSLPQTGRFYVSLTPNDHLWRINSEISLPDKHPIVIANRRRKAQE